MIARTVATGPKGIGNQGCDFSAVDERYLRSFDAIGGISLERLLEDGLCEERLQLLVGETETKPNNWLRQGKAIKIMCRSQISTAFVNG